jgi:hypothetical protein
MDIRDTVIDSRILTEKITIIIVDTVVRTYSTGLPSSAQGEPSQHSSIRLKKRSR